MAYPCRVNTALGLLPFAESDCTKSCYDNYDLELCGFNAQILSGPEGSSNTGCLEQA